MPQDTNIAEKTYDLITDDGETRACDAIAEEACQEAPGSFFKNAFNGFCTKLAEQLTSPGVVIPWVLSVLNASVGLSGLLVPIKNAGSLLPQLIVSAKIRAFAVRKYFWAGAGIMQGIMLALMAWVIYALDGNLAGYLIVAGLFIYSVASGVGSIAFKDVMGKTIPKGKRGRLLALRATGGGVLTVVAGLIFYFYFNENTSEIVYVGLFAIAAVLWWLAAALFASIDEKKGAQEGGRTPIQELKNGFTILKEDTNFRNFLITRALLMAIPLAQPFLILYAREILDASLQGLGLFVIVTGISNAVSSPFWGKFADKSSRGLMAVVAVLGIVTCLYAAFFEQLPDSWQHIYAYAPVFFLIVMAHGGARLSRKTYLVDYAPKKERPLYVSLANTVIGIFTILTAGIGIIAEAFSLQVLLYFLMAMLLVAIVLSIQLKKT
ncbi:MFS transporter [Fulvivirga sp. RKSG066]|uniref:MFS transporter n=1 Tax=Fulvivirga aurantia TaxID=2529383 RepID=UPI0012BB85EA|nr:MFS transporter [Fulvivirga aurantia]MTI21516.1 MFS transporter [Fulvivirga aurantia]